MSFDFQAIAPLQKQLDSHPIYQAVKNIDDLRMFMQHHVYSVWDFMSLVKYLQAQVAPTQYPWVPNGDSQVKRFMTELVLEEECDEAPANPGTGKVYSSHFELYCDAMEEIGADTSPIKAFLAVVRAEGIDKALQTNHLPAASRRFTRTTFDFIQSGKPHTVAAALALGREHIIPDMFRHILKEMDIHKLVAPTFHYYLERHVHLDEGSHAPMSIRLLDMLCHTPAEKQEAVKAAQDAIKARINFWDGVLDTIKARAA